VVARDQRVEAIAALRPHTAQPRTSDSDPISVHDGNQRHKISALIGPKLNGIDRNHCGPNSMQQRHFVFTVLWFDGSKRPFNTTRGLKGHPDIAPCRHGSRHGEGGRARGPFDSKMANKGESVRGTMKSGR